MTTDNNDNNSTDDAGDSAPVDNSGLSPEQIAANEALLLYRKAIEEEFAQESTKVIKGTATDVVEDANAFILKSTKRAFSNIILLMDNAESESVRLQASKYVASLGQLLAAREGGATTDPMQELINELRASAEAVVDDK